MKVTLPTADSKFAHECVAIHKDFLDENIDLECLQHLMFTKTLECLDEFRHKPQPTKPYELEDFEREKRADKWRAMTLTNQIEARKKVFENKVVINYIENSSNIRVKNNSNVIFLIKAYRHYQKLGNFQAVEAIRNMLNTFPKCYRGPIGEEQGQVRVYSM